MLTMVSSCSHNKVKNISVQKFAGKVSDNLKNGGEENLTSSSCWGKDLLVKFYKNLNASNLRVKRS